MAKAKTMSELLAQKDFQIVAPKKDALLSGVITALNKGSVIVDVGAKTEGIITGKELLEVEEYINGLKIGNKIEAVVVNPENNKGQIVLSVRNAANKQKWDFFTDALEKGTALEAKGIETNKGGLIAVVNGVRGFVPSSQFGKKYLGDLDSLKGQTVKVKVIEVDKEKNRLIFSEKFVSEAKELAQREEALKAVEPNGVYEGVVSGLMPFGLFVTVEIPVDGKGDVGLVEGLVHISEISWEKVDHPANYHQLGERIKVKVMDIDENNNKLNLSIKKLSPDPWEQAVEKYPVGTVISGTVSRVEPFGVFINIEPGIDGLVHSSKLTGNENLQKGERVSVNVENVDKENKRMSLTLISNELPVDYK